MVDAVIFDFGGVLTSSPANLMAARAAEFGHDIRDVMHLLLGPYEEDTDHPWHRIERGEISFDEMVEGMVGVFAEAGLDNPMSPPPPEQVLAAMTPAVPMIEVAAAARASGRRTAILTNNIADWDWRPTVGADELVDEVIDSCEVGLRKPDEAIYRLAMNRLGVDDPSRCVFLDDFAWNIAGASAVGMQTIHVEDHTTAAADLRVLLGM